MYYPFHFICQQNNDTIPAQQPLCYRGTPGSNGVNGLPGKPGIPGNPGAPGRDGRDGAKGHLGSPGRTGPQGPPGTKGELGVQGPAGQKGLVGKSCDFSSHINWKECAWKRGDGKDAGEIYVRNFSQRFVI